MKTCIIWSSSQFLCDLWLVESDRHTLYLPHWDFLIDNWKTHLVSILQLNICQIPDHAKTICYIKIIFYLPFSFSDIYWTKYIPYISLIIYYIVYMLALSYIQLNVNVFIGKYYFFKLYWYIIDMLQCVSLRCTVCWFDTLIYCKMITM